MDKKIYAAAILVLTAIVPATVTMADESPPRATLSQDILVEEVLRNNPRVKAARAAYEAASADVSVVSWPRQPMIFYEERISPAGSPRATMFGAEQTIPMPPNKLLVGRAEAKARSMASAAALDEIIRVTVSKTKNAYWEYYFTARSLQERNENLKLLESLATTAEARYVSGKKSKADFVRAAAEIAMEENEIMRLDAEISRIAAELNALRGSPEDAVLPAPDVSVDIVGDVPHISASQIAKAARENSAEASKMSELGKAAAERRRFETLSWMPDIRVGAKFDRMENTQDETRLMLAADVPLWLPKQSAAVKSAGQIENEAVNNIETALLEAEASALTLYHRIVYLSRAIGNFKTAILPAAEQALEIVRADYIAGRAGFTDLIETQRNLISQKISLANAISEYHKNTSELEVITGKLPSGHGGHQ